MEARGNQAYNHTDRTILNYTQDLQAVNLVVKLKSLQTSPDIPSAIDLIYHALTFIKADNRPKKM